MNYYCKKDSKFDYYYFYNIATYNIGKPRDYKNLIIRNGAQHPDPVIQGLYQQIILGYDEALKSYNENKAYNNSYKNDPQNFTTQDELNVIGNKRNECLMKVYAIMAEKCDIVMLQEVTNSNELQLIKNIFTKSFKFQYDQKKSSLDAIVGWRKDVFRPLKEVKDAFPNIKMASVILQDISNGMVIQVTSLHANGYSLTKPTKEDVNAGDHLVLKASKEVTSPHVDVALIGGDYNSYYAPLHDSTNENFDIAQNRFKILENNGFFHVPQSAPTCYNGELNGTVDLDHLFVKEKRKLVNVDVLPFCFYDFPLENPEKNSSDHKPLFFEATICSKTIIEHNKQKRLELKKEYFK